MKNTRKQEYIDTIDKIDKMIKEEYKNMEFSLILPEFVKMCKGNANFAIVLSRIFYWYRPNQFGGNKFHARIGNSDTALAKSAKEMSIETGIDVSTVKRAYKALVELGYIEIHIRRFNGHPTSHIVIKGQQFADAFYEAHRQFVAELAHYEGDFDSYDFDFDFDL